ncbi:MAG: hypothetical protein M3O35_03420 [Acidobacteriota bacterium]|nr:hypothetical protein [Acidobacteriota bacterium]
MGSPIHVALVPENVSVDAGEVTRVAGAVSKQVERDFGPLWSIDATVDPFMKLEDVPVGYWPIIIMQDVKGAEGYHQDKNGQPFALIKFHGQWFITASHECLEMLADPFGNHLQAGNLLDQAVELGMDPARVQYLVEVCDPSESADFSYQVDGIQVSDFYTPQFFDPVQAPDTRYSLTGAIDAPRKILDGGYISWTDPVSNNWFQLRMFPDQFSTDVPHVVNLTTQTTFEQFKMVDGLRGASDRVTRQDYWTQNESPATRSALEHGKMAARAQVARAEGFRKMIAELVKEAGGS